MSDSKNVEMCLRFPYRLRLFAVEKRQQCALVGLIEIDQRQHLPHTKHHQIIVRSFVRLGSRLFSLLSLSLSHYEQLDGTVKVDRDICRRRHRSRRADANAIAIRTFNERRILMTNPNGANCRKTYFACTTANEPPSVDCVRVHSRQNIKTRVRTQRRLRQGE